MLEVGKVVQKRIKIFWLNCLVILSCLATFESSCLAEELKNLEAYKLEMEKRSLPILKEFKKKRQVRSFSYYKGKIQIDEIGDHISFHYYKSSHKKSKAKPLVLIFPGFTGLTPLDYYMGRYFAKRGYNVAISHYRDEKNELDPECIDISVKNGLLASLAVLDTVVQFDEVDSEKIATLGYSFGGIRASFLATIEDRISSVMLIVSAGNLSRAMSKSKFPAVRKLRKLHMNRLKETSTERYEEYLKNKFPFEPYQHFNKADNSNYLIVTSKMDIVVPWDVQNNLVTQLINPKHICYGTLGHCSSVCWFVVRHLHKSKQLLKQVWEMEKNEEPESAD